MKTNSFPCTSPRRNQCRRGTARPGRSKDPAQWGCVGRELFQGPLERLPISDKLIEPKRVPTTVKSVDYI